MTATLRRRGSLPRWGARVLLVLLIAASAGGCSSKQALTPEQQAQADLAAYEQEIRRIIPAPARADQLVALASEFQQLANESIANVRGYRQRVAALNANYDATREEYEALFNQQDAAREAFVNKAGAIRERMVAFTSDAEWEQLKTARLRVVEADLQELLK